MDKLAKPCKLTDGQSKIDEHWVLEQRVLFCLAAFPGLWFEMTNQRQGAGPSKASKGNASEPVACLRMILDAAVVADEVWVWAGTSGDKSQRTQQFLGPCGGWGSD